MTKLSLGVNFRTGLILLTLTLAKCQDYTILELEDDDFTYWDRIEQVNAQSQQLLSTLCENYDMTLNNQLIDCPSIQLLPKNSFWEVNEEILVDRKIAKREVEEPLLEGSGNDNIQLAPLGDIGETPKEGDEPTLYNAESEEPQVELAQAVGVKENESEPEGEENKEPEPEVPVPQESEQQSEVFSDGEPPAPGEPAAEEPPAPAEPAVEEPPTPEEQPTREEIAAPAPEELHVEEPSEDELPNPGEQPPTHEEQPTGEKLPEPEEQPPTSEDQPIGEGLPAPVPEEQPTGEDQLGPAPEDLSVEVPAEDDLPKPEEQPSPFDEQPTGEGLPAPVPEEQPTGEKQLGPALEELPVGVPAGDDLPKPEEQPPTPEEQPIGEGLPATPEEQQTGEDQPTPAPEPEEPAREPSVPEESTDEEPVAPGEPQPPSEKQPAVVPQPENVAEGDAAKSLDDTESQPPVDNPQAGEETDKVSEQTEKPISDFKLSSLDKQQNKEEETSRSETTLPPQTQDSAKDDSVKEPEKIDENQSGVAVLNKEPSLSKSSSVEGSDTDKFVSSLQVNEETTGASEQPKTGESAKDVSTAAAGKDATVLIVLFVVVLVIGAAAFTHHFIKKRRANNEQNSINSITKEIELIPRNGDVEQGVELKPLLNSNQPIIVKEFSDKKNDEAKTVS